MVFQHPQLLRRSVYKNVAYGLDLRGKEADPEQVNAVIEQLGLAGASAARGQHAVRRRSAARGAGARACAQTSGAAAR